VWNVIEMDTIKKADLAVIRGALLTMKQNIEKTAIEFVEAKNTLVEEVKKLSTYIGTEVIPRFDPSDIIKTILWVDTVCVILLNVYRKEGSRSWMWNPCSS